MPVPVLVECVRGDMVESVHRGSLVIAHADSGQLLGIGMTETPIYPRSSVKLLQGLPLVETGAADHFDFTPYELALACASHSGEQRHVDTALGILKRIGLDEDALACGPHWPGSATQVHALAARHETPGKAYNNCSGKHAGMLATCMHLGLDPVGYERREHPVQQAIFGIMSDVFQTDMTEAPCGIDGCSLPTLGVSLSVLARGFARLMGDGEIAVERRAAADRLMRACMSEPHAVAGLEQFDTEVMEVFGERVFLKTGAEAVYVIAFPDLKIAAAIKIEDGATRASQIVAAAIIQRFAVQSAAEDDFMAGRTRPVLRNAAGLETGYLQAVPALVQSLTTFG